jgi:hypothetical protein
MKNTSLLFLVALAFVSCNKSSNPGPAPVNNGPIGGTYAFTALTDKFYDTIPGSGIVTMNEYTSTTTNHKGSVSITANNISSKGLMYDYTTTGTHKEMNTTTGATTTTNYSPLTGTSGSASTAYNSNYTIDVTALELTIDNAQYLFDPAFISQPSNKKYSYTLTGNTLKVITNTYSATTRSRTVSEGTFTKQ